MDVSAVALEKHPNAEWARLLLPTVSWCLMPDDQPSLIHDQVPYSNRKLGATGITSHRILNIMVCGCK